MLNTSRFWYAVALVGGLTAGSLCSLTGLV